MWIAVDFVFVIPSVRIQNGNGNRYELLTHNINATFWLLGFNFLKWHFKVTIRSQWKNRHCYYPYTLHDQEVASP